MRFVIAAAFSMLPLTALAEVPRVITDIVPIYGLVAQVMGDLGQPVLLLEKGADEHDFQLRPSQMSDISSADIAVWMGPELTPWLERALQGGNGGVVSLPLLALPATQTLNFAEGEKHDHAHGDEADHAQDNDADSGRGHLSVDPHAWLNPKNGVLWLDAIAAALSQKDAGNASVYAANAAAAAAQITALDAELGLALSGVKNQGFVTYHDAYQYFTAHYGLAFKGSVSVGDASRGGAAHLRALQDQIATGVVCVFPEVQHDADLLMQLTAGTMVKTGPPLDPVGAAMDPTSSAYSDVLRTLTAALTQCLGGA